MWGTPGDKGCLRDALPRVPRWKAVVPWSCQGEAVRCWSLSLHQGMRPGASLRLPVGWHRRLFATQSSLPHQILALPVRMRS